MGQEVWNQSAVFSALAALGLPWRRSIPARGEVFGRLPAGVDIPLVPYTRRWVLLRLLPLTVRNARMVGRLERQVPAFIARTPHDVERLLAAIDDATSPAALLALWRTEIERFTTDGLRLLLAGLSEYRSLSRALHRELEKLVGEEDTNALLSGVSAGADQLASLGPLIGLLAVSRGQMSRGEYVKRYGHRGPHEMELSTPRPAEDPSWIDRQLADLHRVDVQAMLARQQGRHGEAWKRLQRRLPARRARHYGRQLDRLTRAAQRRESSRSETARALGVLRSFALRIGKLTGLGEGVFFLSLREALVALEGDMPPEALLLARKETYARLSALPPYPAVICGRFDPMAWAADPARRTDFFGGDAEPPEPEAGTLTGFAGAAGVVEGVVRRLSSPEEAGQLLPGEILVAVTTNIGWTPLFPKAAAIVTDVGAPFSHAAIVARELGIPAVVGCGDATMRLHTGDRVRVDGGQGTVHILSDGE